METQVETTSGEVKSKANKTISKAENLISLKPSTIEKMSKVEVMKKINKAYSGDYDTFHKIYTDETWALLQKKLDERIKKRRHKLGFDIIPKPTNPSRPEFRKGKKIFQPNHDNWQHWDSVNGKYTLVSAIDATEEEIKAIREIYRPELEV